MSGIVGIVNLDGAPIDRDLLRRMTDFLAFRGPDAQEVWVEGSVGFGHAMLRTTFEAERERQPFTLDGQVWITADARIDARPELKRELRAGGRRDVKEATDVELILHAYHAWGEDCVRHLLGDFAFAIWDGPRRRLFCARDHFGVRPLYYSHVGSSFIFSNTLDCVRLHPGVSGRLNELAIADFLLFGFNQEADTTTFADVRSLAPAHRLLADSRTLRTDRYWALPVQTLRFRGAREHTEGFREALELAVRDRLRVGQAGVLMSGGLDSTSVAATACRLLEPGNGRPRLAAYTCVYERLIPDDERHWADLAATHFGIPIHHVQADDYRLYERWEHPEYRPSEPVDSAVWALSVDILRRVAKDHRVVLTGEGGDGAFVPPRPLSHLVRSGHLAYLCADALRYWRSHGRPPGLGARTWLWKVIGRSRPTPALPAWLDGGFARRQDLRWRLERAFAAGGGNTAYDWLTSLSWPWALHFRDGGWTRTPVEARHPFFDTRLLAYVLGIPSAPWNSDKELLRAAMKGSLPEPILVRPKAPLAGEPVWELLKAAGPERVAGAATFAEAEGFVDGRAFQEAVNKSWLGLDWDWDAVTRTLSLSRWLQTERTGGVR